MSAHIGENLDILGNNIIEKLMKKYISLMKQERTDSVELMKKYISLIFQKNHLLTIFGQNCLTLSR